MIVLLTNDDGFDSPGIQTLAQVFAQKHTVYIAAPKSNQSATSSSISIRKKHEVLEREQFRFQIDGTPVDCVVEALRCGLFPQRPHVVISGINSGSNLGTDILYSGTCGAAREACIQGLPAIALSVARPSDFRDCSCSYRQLAQFAADNIESLIELSGNAERFVNVNALPSGPYRGVRYATLSKLSYDNTIQLTKQDDGKMFVEYIPVNDGTRKAGGDGNDDHALVDKGYIAISCIRAFPECDMTVSFKEQWGGTWQDKTP